MVPRHVGSDRCAADCDSNLSWSVNMGKADDRQQQQFLKELMEIQRKYANELKNAKTNRQEDVRDLLEKFVVGESSNAD